MVPREGLQPEMPRDAWLPPKHDRRFLWLVSAATSLLTSKSLLAGEFTYPLHLVAMHLTVVAVSQAILGTGGAALRARPPLSAITNRSGVVSAAIALSYVAALGASLGLGYKVIMHCSSLPVAMMILTLDWQPTQLVRRVLRRQLSLNDAIRYLLFIFGILLIFVWDYRLKDFAPTLCIGFLLSVGLAELFHDLLHESASEGSLLLIYQPFNVANWPLLLLPPLVLIAHVDEIWRPTTWIPIYPTGVLILINIATTAAAIHTGGFIFKALSFRTTGSSLSSIPINPMRGLDRLLVMLTLCSLVSAGDWFSSTPPAVLSLWQYVGYFLSFFAFATQKDLHDAVSTTRWHSTQRKAEPERTVSTDTTAKKTVNRKSRADSLVPKWLVVFACVSWLIFTSLASTVRPPRLDFAKSKLDIAFRHSSELDIVVARYNEPTADLMRDLKALLQLPNIQQLRPRIIIYNKGSDETQFKSSISEDMVERVSIVALENVGREGDTWLHHITSNWDDLARHTLFMQAEPHYISLLKHRLEDYFIPETGFMSFSYEGVVCTDCNHCHDRYGSEDPVVFADLYSQANPGECHDLVMTYYGQFIVSGARIRGNEKAMYEKIMHEIRDPNSWMHAPEYTQSVWNKNKHDPDSMTAPVFGYALESMWGVLMQCSELRVGYWSPSLLSGYVRSQWLGRKFPLENVQCLDRPIA